MLAENTDFQLDFAIVEANAQFSSCPYSMSQHLENPCCPSRHGKNHIFISLSQFILSYPAFLHVMYSLHVDLTSMICAFLDRHNAKAIKSTLKILLLPVVTHKIVHHIWFMIMFSST